MRSSQPKVQQANHLFFLSLTMTEALKSLNIYHIFLKNQPLILLPINSTTFPSMQDNNEDIHRQYK